MKTVQLKFGTGTLPLRLPITPGFAGVFRPSQPPAVSDMVTAVRDAIEHPPCSLPLRRLARGRTDACVVVSDSTRAVPNRELLPPLLAVIEDEGIPPERIVILIATGLHEPSTRAEKEQLVGPEIVARYRVVDHRAQEPDGLVWMGTIGDGVPLWIDRHYAEADLKVLTGLIEPHMWAGFSGGRKSILPGISGVETVRRVHGPAMVDHPKTRPGLLEGNPFHELALEAMERAGADFLVNVTVDGALATTGVFAGDPIQAHARGCAFLASHSTRRVPAELDFLVTTNGGSPLDCNLYQSAKGISCAADVVRPGGAMLVTAACPLGTGSPDYQRVLAAIDEPRAFLARLHRGELFMPDQWCAQEAMRVALDHEIWFHSTGVGPADVAPLGLRWAEDPQATLEMLLERYGPDARWAVVPDGPWVVLEPEPVEAP